MSRIKRILLTLVATLGLVAPMAAVASAADAAVEESLACGASLNFEQGVGCDNDGTEAGRRVDTIVKNVINIISLIVGIAAVVMIIIGGLRYVTSNGDSGQVGNAKNTILYAVVGLVVVALAQVIVRFVVAKATTEG